MMDVLHPTSFRSDRREKFLAQQILALADRLALKVTAAESCTGGRLAALLTDVEGLSHSFECGFVPYSDQAKTSLLGVPAALIDLDGAVSAPVAKLMAKGALGRAEAGIAVAITGFAGPGAPGEESGLVHIATVDCHGTQHHQEFHFGSDDRQSVRDQSIMAALTMLHEHLLSLATNDDVPEPDEPLMLARVAV